jgi:hypothetical protein
MAMPENRGLVGSAVDSAKLGVDVVTNVGNEVVDGVDVNSDRVIDLGQKIKNLGAEGTKLTVAEAGEIAKDILDRIGRVLGG